MPFPSKQLSLEEHLQALRTQLVRLKPAGSDGFEGLIASALAGLTGLTFRLAKSGSQFGRDASTPRARFAIAMEAKRYADTLRLEDLAGKIWVASNELATDVDLWVLCATAEVGDGVLAKLEVMLEERGITLLALDWTSAPFPRIAVLLAAVRPDVIARCAAHPKTMDSGIVEAALTALATETAYDVARLRLVADCSERHVGLGALASANRE